MSNEITSGRHTLEGVGPLLGGERGGRGGWGGRGFGEWSDGLWRSSGAEWQFQVIISAE